MSELETLLFETMKVIFLFMLTSSIFLNFLGFFHFPTITQKPSGFPGTLEISFKVETLMYTEKGDKQLSRVMSSASPLPPQLVNVS